MEYDHVPVMLPEVLDFLKPQPGDYFLDGTLGGGSYTFALADAVGATGKVLALDLDAAAITHADERIKNKKLSNIILVRDNFKNLVSAVRQHFPAGQKFSGLVLDLGLSAYQLDDATRGFSFQGNRPLDMAFGTDSPNSTATIVNQARLEELTRIFREYGEERQAYRIAKLIVDRRREKKITTTRELIDIITAILPVRPGQKIHPATRIFQALRIATNDELANLAAVLPEAISLLKPGGRLVVISFHSGEDRIVKNFFRDPARPDESARPPALKILTKKPLIPSAEEAAINPKSRSAKLRAAVKLPLPA